MNLKEIVASFLGVITVLHTLVIFLKSLCLSVCLSIYLSIYLLIYLQLCPWHMEVSQAGIKSKTEL